MKIVTLLEHPLSKMVDQTLFISGQQNIRRCCFNHIEHADYTFVFWVNTTGFC